MSLEEEMEKCTRECLVQQLSDRDGNIMHGGDTSSVFHRCMEKCWLKLHLSKKRQQMLKEFIRKQKEAEYDE